MLHSLLLQRQMGNDHSRRFKYTEVAASTVTLQALHILQHDGKGNCFGRWIFLSKVTVGQRRILQEPKAIKSVSHDRISRKQILLHSSFK